LIALLANGGLNPGEARSARRTLVALALSENDRIKAIRRLENVVKHDPDDADSLANLAILQRAEGIAGSRATMQRAIAIRNSADRSVPASWSRFAEAD
jgi:Tfp pilus assembly protein PilF